MNKKLILDGELNITVGITDGLTLNDVNAGDPCLESWELSPAMIPYAGITVIG
jgi:hypothetical protein